MGIQFDNTIVYIWPVGILLLAAVLGFLWRRGRRPAYLFCVALFGVYLLLALDVTLFPIAVNGAYADALRQVPFASQINLVPFYFGPFASASSLLLTSAKNIVLTMPFGFGLSFVRRQRAGTFLWLAPAVGLLIEATQLAISLLLGYPYRVIDVNDVLCNAVGVWLGYGCFRVFCAIYLKSGLRGLISARR